MFTTRDRDRLRDTLVAVARDDGTVLAAAVVGSGAAAGEDDWSDIDLALRLDGRLGVLESADIWSARLCELAPVAATMDVWAGDALYRVFLLTSTLQIDLSFWPPGSFRARGEHFRLLFGDLDGPTEKERADADAALAWGWLYALHARSAIARRRSWQAVHMLEGMRNQVIALHCIRHGVPFVQGRGVDRLPTTITARLAETLIFSLDDEHLRERFRVLTRLLVDEAHRLGGDDERLRSTLHGLVTSLEGPPSAAD